MKNTVKIFGIIVITAIIAVSAAGCGGGGLSGSYSLTGGGDLTYNFSGGKFTMETGGKVMGDGTFSAKGGKLTMNVAGTEQTMDYKLEGKNLILSVGGQSLTFAKK